MYKAVFDDLLGLTDLCYHFLHLLLLGRVMLVHLGPNGLFELSICVLVVMFVKVFEELKRVVAQVLDTLFRLCVHQGLLGLVGEILEKGFDMKAFFGHDIVKDNRILLRERLIASNELGLGRVVHRTYTNRFLEHFLTESYKSVFVHCVGTD